MGRGGVPFELSTVSKSVVAQQTDAWAPLVGRQRGQNLGPNATIMLDGSVRVQPIAVPSPRFVSLGSLRPGRQGPTVPEKTFFIHACDPLC